MQLLPVAFIVDGNLQSPKEFLILRGEFDLAIGFEAAFGLGSLNVSIVLVGLTAAALFLRFVMRLGRPEEEELASAPAGDA